MCNLTVYINPFVSNWENIFLKCQLRRYTILQDLYTKTQKVDY